ncbi:MAG: LexA family protein [Acidaminococcus sp.]|uniref:LexA family protein n=1 Tax=Acidaminococcus sp. TaxID=1872103 RepID=UPI003F150B13
MSDLGNREIMAQNIKYYMDKNNKTRNEICHDLGFAYSTFSDWVNGKKYPRIDKIELMAKYFNVSKTDLVERHQKGNGPQPTRGVRIPVLGRVVAGIPLEAITDIIDYEEIPAQMAKSGTYFALQVKGRSMEPTLHEGDVVIVRQQPEVENGEIAIVLVNGNDATVKEVKEGPDGLTLIGHNVGVYSPHFYTKEQIQDLPIQILGKVVELRRKF